MFLKRLAHEFDSSSSSKVPKSPFLDKYPKLEMFTQIKNEEKTTLFNKISGFGNSLTSNSLFIGKFQKILTKPYIYQNNNLGIGSYPLHPKTFHPRTFILNFSSLPFILNNSSFLFNALDFSFTNSSPPFYPTPCNLFQIICYISYPLNSYSSK